MCHRIGPCGKQPTCSKHPKCGKSSNMQQTSQKKGQQKRIKLYYGYNDNKPISCYSTYIERKADCRSGKEQLCLQLTSYLISTMNVIVTRCSKHVSRAWMSCAHIRWENGEVLCDCICCLGGQENLHGIYGTAYLI